MHIRFLEDVFQEAAERPALIHRDKAVTYRSLTERISRSRDRIAHAGISTGNVVMLCGDYSPQGVAGFLALIDAGCIVVPQLNSSADGLQRSREIAQAEFVIQIDEEDSMHVERSDNEAQHALYRHLRAIEHPGLVFFSSGSTGRPKAAVHDLLRLLEKFKTPRSRFRTLSFLLFDHIGGVNTLLYTLSNAGWLATVSDRSPESVCKIIARHRVQLLPTSPTFLNLLLLSGAHEKHDLSSLELITYGTEVMPSTTLKRLAEVFPSVRLLQTYGLSEIGIMRSKSRSSDSVWVKLGGEGYHTRVVDSQLQIKADSAMLGYLNAPSPITADGWFMTGDTVDVDGEYFRVLGRSSDLINVGGEKVYPAEVENLIQSVPNVADVTVFGRKNPLTGQMVCAAVQLSQPEPAKPFIARLKKLCLEKLAPYKMPVKIEIVNEITISSRGKKVRNVV